MMEFLKTFGKGILYFIGFPFLLIFLIGYGFYLLFIFFQYLIKVIVYFFKGKKVSLKDDLDDEAYKILKSRKEQSLNPQNGEKSPQITNNFINFDPSMFNKQTSSNPSKIEDKVIDYSEDDSHGIN